MNKKKQARQEVLVEDFVRIWQDSKNLAEVAKRARITASYASYKASHLRARGVPLKKFRQTQGLDIEALTTLARSAE